MRHNNPHICAICHLKGTGCCLFVPGLEDQMFGLTSGEIEAICTHTGLSPDAFTIQDIARKDFLDGLALIHPVFLSTMPEGRRIRLLIKDDKCVFLGHDGCTLPNEIRPLFCRLYPFWFTPGNRLMVLTSGRCLAQTNALSTDQVVSRLEMNKENIKKLFEILMDLANRHYDHYMKTIANLKTKQPSP